MSAIYYRPCPTQQQTSQQTFRTYFPTQCQGGLNNWYPQKIFEQYVYMPSSTAGRNWSNTQVLTGTQGLEPFNINKSGGFFAPKQKSLPQAHIHQNGYSPFPQKQQLPQKQSNFLGVGLVESQVISVKEQSPSGLLKENEALKTKLGVVEQNLSRAARQIQDLQQENQKQKAEFEAQLKELEEQVAEIQQRGDKLPENLSPSLVQDSSDRIVETSNVDANSKEKTSENE